MKNKLTTHFKIEFGFGMGISKNAQAISVQESERQLQAVEGRVARLFGAATTIRTNGNWTSPTGKLYVEPGATVFTCVEQVPDGALLSAENFTKAQAIVDFIKGLLDQEAVCVTISTVLFGVV